MAGFTDVIDTAPPALLRVSPPLEVKLAGDGADLGVISGHASVYGGEPDSYGDVIAVGAYRDTLEDHRKAGTMPAMLWSHALSELIGRWTEIREDERGLFVRGQLNLNTNRGREAFAHLRAKDLNGLSIGYRIRPDGYRLQSDGTRLLTSVDLAEISVVALPAARAARITEVKSVASPAETAALADLIRRVDAARLELRSLTLNRYR